MIRSDVLRVVRMKTGSSHGLVFHLLEIGHQRDKDECEHSIETLEKVRFESGMGSAPEQLQFFDEVIDILK